MSIPVSFIQDLLSRVDIVDVVGRYVQLKKSGGNYIGLCPFHGEKSPSFSVSPSKQFFHCFGCGKGGDAIAFLKEHTGMDFVETVQSLASEVGMEVPQEHFSQRERDVRTAHKQQQATLNEVLERAGDAWRRQLKAHAHAVQYLKGRGVSGAVSSRYGLGYAPAGWNFLASVFPEYNAPVLAESGLLVTSDDAGATGTGHKRYDRFRDRIMFPIRDTKGQCIGFGGRVLGHEKPKYLNSPETMLFHKGRELYGLFEARDAVREMGYVLVTEGYMDVVALAQMGFPNAVATLGTACTAEHVQKLLRFTDTVVFSFDGDNAGRRAAGKALEAVLPCATDTRSIKFLFLPAEHDPDSFIRTHGPDAFARQVQDATSLNQFLLQTASEDCDLGTAQGRARLSSQARPLWSLLPDGAFKRLVLGELSQHIQLGTHELGEVWSQAAMQQGRRHQRPAADTSHTDYMSFAKQTQHDTRLAYTSTGHRRAGYHVSSAPSISSPQPSTGPDQAARLLLSCMALMEHLNNDDMDALVHLPAPHGPLFAWIEGQYQEHGPQPWAILRTWVTQSAQAASALRLMSGPHAHPEGDERELHQELRSILNQLLAQRIKVLEDAAIADMVTDPDGARQRYRALQERRKQLLAPVQKQ